MASDWISSLADPMAIAQKALNAERGADVDSRSTPAGSDLAKLAQGLVHAIRNPLFNVHLELHTLKSQTRQPGHVVQASQVAALVERCTQQLDRIEGVLCDLVDFACPLARRIEVVDLRGEIQHVLAEMHEKTPGLRAEQDSAPHISPLIAVDVGQLRATLNAAIWLMWQVNEGHDLCVTVSENPTSSSLQVRAPNCQLAASILREAFAPFARLGNVSTELKLAAAQRQIIEAQGEIECGHDPVHGAVLTIRFPRANGLKKSLD